MPASSKAQQRFMGMVHAKQKGELPNASTAVSKAADSMSDKSAEEFASTSHKGLPDRVKKEGTLGQIIGLYNSHGQKLRESASMREMAEDLMELAEFAEQAIMSEADDWYDGHTIKRNMKEMKSYVKEFYKIAEEYDGMRQRATALYDDMGRVLERYFELQDNSDLGDASYGTDDEGDEIVAGNGAKNPVDGITKQQLVPTDTMSDDLPIMPNAELPVAGDNGGQGPAPQEPTPESEEDAAKNKDLIQRLLKLARHKLTGEQLAKFDVLPEETQIKAAWRMVR